MKPLVTNKNGFTVSDVLIILSVMAILAASAAPSYFKFVENAKKSVAIEALKTAQKFMKDYFIANGTFPAKVNFSTCTDGNNSPVFPQGTCEQLKKNISSFESYSSATSSYLLIARATDSSHTLLRLTSNGIVEEVPLH